MYRFVDILHRTIDQDVLVFMILLILCLVLFFHPCSVVESQLCLVYKSLAGG